MTYFLVPATPFGVVIPGPAPAPAQATAPAPGNNTNTNHANHANHANNAANHHGNRANDENDENAPPSRRQQERLNTSELRRRARRINPLGESQPRFRRVLGRLNGQVVRETRAHTLDEIEGEGARQSRYIDLTDGTVPEGALADPYSFPSSWTVFEENA
ncbi:hypothetical protein C8Q77DRAFT_1156330 [Trametes polyzona]|nr:hypothetical protein C8Q77DRAFT_1156330 [Trametes polyzona]